MQLKIDKAGRILVPKSLRDRLGLKTEMDLELVERPDGVLLRPIEQRPSMLNVGGLWVHQGSPIPEANWEGVLDDVRTERLDTP